VAGFVGSRNVLTLTFLHGGWLKLSDKGLMVFADLWFWIGTTWPSAQDVPVIVIGLGHVHERKSDIFSLGLFI